MARPLPVEYPGAFYHVVNRGNAGEKIFKSKRDREKFFEYLEKAVERFSIRIHTFCLMTNHFHLLVETPKANLSKAIQWVNVSYATYFNRKRRRNGHLFEGRFKSIVVDADEYLKHLSRYIHLNPVRANIVQSPGEYPWSSYSAFIGKTKAPEWLETGWLLSQFGRKRKASAKNYRDFVEKVNIAELDNPEKDLTGGFILGGSEFVGWIRETFLSSRAEEKEIPQLRQLKRLVDKQAVVETVSKEFGCSSEWILKRGRKKNTARDMAIYLARDLTGETCKNLGAYFDGISGAGITVRYNHMSRELKRNRRLRARSNRMQRQIIKD